MKYSPWILHNIPKEKPYLILGKGPSLDKVFKDKSILEKYHTIGLNHVGIFLQCDYIHFIDMDVPYAYPENKKPNKLICPWRPHTNFKVSKYNLTKFQITDIKDSIFYWYNCSTWKGEPKTPVDPLIVTKLFSAESVFQLLVHQGIHRICSLGIDGGKEYHPVFEEIATPLQNGQPSFDKGIVRLNQICLEHRIEWTRL